MFLLNEIQKLLTDIIPSAPDEGVFDKYEITGKPFFDKGNNALITPVIIFKPFGIYENGDERWRSIYFYLKKRERTHSQTMLFGGTIEVLSRITVEEFMNKINTISGRMLASLSDVE